MPTEAWGIALVAALVVAGCLASTTGDELREASTEPTAALPAGVPTEAQLDERSLDAPPTWYEGEWWRFEVDAALTGETYEATVVVAGAREDEILLGLPEESFDDAAIVVHFPPTGPMRTEDLSWYFHSDRFTMTPFPLEPGKTWGFEWVGAETEAEVVSVDGTTAEIDVLHPNAHLMLTYDARSGFVTDMTWEGLASYRVVDHGFGYEGTVVVPDDPTLAIFEGRLAGVVDMRAPPQPGPPAMTVDVPSGRDTMSLGFILGEVVTDGAGVYRAAATGPDGTTYEERLDPRDGASAVLRAHHVTDPAGTWTLDFEAAGTGAALVEGVAYDALTIELPRGALSPAS